MRRRTGKYISCKMCKKQFYVPKCYLKTKRCCSNKCKYIFVGSKSKGRKNTWWKKGITIERNEKISRKLKKRIFSKEHRMNLSIARKKCKIVMTLKKIAAIKKARESVKFRRTKKEL